MTRKKTVVIIALVLVLGVAIGAVGLYKLSGTKDDGNDALVGSVSAVKSPTAKGLVQWVTRAYNECWDYVYGGATPGAVDDSGLICSYVSAATHNTEAMLASASVSGSISAIPEIPGIAVYMPGHVGVYIGGGMVIDARNEQMGVVLSSVSAAGWTQWFYVNGVVYGDETQSPNNLIGTVSESGEQNGWHQTQDGKWQYFENGTQITGWRNDIPGLEGQWFYFDPDTGEMVTGWKNDIPGWDGQWFYFDPDSGMMADDGWQLLDKDWYYFGAGGSLYTNCTTPDGQNVDESGKRVEQQTTGLGNPVAGMSEDEAFQIALGLAEGKDMGMWKTMSADEFLRWWSAANK